jgi:mercuric ion binding protein
MQKNCFCLAGKPAVIGLFFFFAFRFLFLIPCQYTFAISIIEELVMKTVRFLAPLFVLAGFAVTASAADTTVTLSDVHLCCSKCVSGVKTAVAPVTGVNAVCDTTAKTVVLTAPDEASAQKAVDALTAAGYFGKSSDSSIKVDAATGAPDATVSTLEITHLHLCCGSCVNAVNDVLAKVPGVTANTAKTKAASFTVTGDFNAKAVMDEFQKAGLTGTAVATPK